MNRPAKFGFSGNPWSGGSAKPLGRFSDLSFAALKLTAWCTVTASCVVAAFALFFLMLGEFRLDGMLLHLDNFSHRYLAAADARRTTFEGQLAWAAFILFISLGFFRRHSLFPLIEPRKETQHGE